MGEKNKRSKIMIIFFLFKKKINAHIKKLGPSKLRAKIKLLFRNIFDFRNILLKKQVKIRVEIDK